LEPLVPRHEPVVVQDGPDPAGHAGHELGEVRQAELFDQHDHYFCDHVRPGTRPLVGQMVLHDVPDVLNRVEVGDVSWPVDGEDALLSQEVPDEVGAVTGAP
jgi:hypothetical protein